MTKSTANERHNQNNNKDYTCYGNYQDYISKGHNDSGSKSRYFDIDVWAEKH